MSKGVSMENYHNKIDLVYLWVDGNDPAWQTKRNAFIGRTEENSSINCKGRYANNDELKYSLRSIEMYAPWIRNIFIVTDNQVPEWLDLSNPKIKVVDHTEILPSESLPCFNSSLIEHFICKISGLSEYFLFANDDMFINKPVYPHTFFAEDGLPIIRLTNSLLRDWFLSFKEKFLGIPFKNYVQIIRNSAKLVEHKFGVYYRVKPHHNIDAYLKSDCERVEKMFHFEISRTLSNHIRNANDLQRSLYTFVALAENRCHPLHVTQKISFRFHIQKIKHYDKLKKYDPVFFCMNDSEYANDSDRERVKDFLSKRFPKKSSFEK